MTPQVLVHQLLVDEPSVSCLHSPAHSPICQVSAETTQELGLLTGTKKPAASLALKVLQERWHATNNYTDN